MLHSVSQKVLVLFIVLGMFSSCNDDEDKDPEPTAITITGSDYEKLQKVGSQTTFKTLDNTKFTQLPTIGENQVWDLTEYETANSVTLINPENLPVPSGTSFTSATFVRKRPSSFIAAFNLTTFYEVSEQGYFLVGNKVDAISVDLGNGTTLSSEGNEQPYNDKEIVFKFPATYNQTAQSQTVVNENYLLTAPAFGLNNAPVERRITDVDNIEVVGWGKVLLPQGAITNSTDVLLIASTGTRTNNYFLNGNTAPASLLGALGIVEGATDSDVFYYFLSKEFGIVAIVGFSIDENGTTQFPSDLAEYTVSHTK